MVTNTTFQELVTYIKQQLQLQLPIPTITQSLVEIGWGRDIIAQALETAQEHYRGFDKRGQWDIVSSLHPMSNIKRIAKRATVLIVVVVVFGVFVTTIYRLVRLAQY